MKLFNCAALTFRAVGIIFPLLELLIAQPTNAARLQDVSSCTLPDSWRTAEYRYTWQMDQGTSCVFILQQYKSHENERTWWTMRYPNNYEGYWVRQDWTSEIGRYNSGEVLSAISGTLGDFITREHPREVLSITLPAHFLRENWNAMLLALRRRMLKYPSSRGGDHKLRKYANEAVAHATFRSSLDKLVRKFGWRITDAYLGTDHAPTVDFSITWKEAVRQPYLSLKSPSSVVYHLEPRLRSE